MSHSLEQSRPSETPSKRRLSLRSGHDSEKKQKQEHGFSHEGSRSSSQTNAHTDGDGPNTGTSSKFLQTASTMSSPASSAGGDELSGQEMPSIRPFNGSASNHSTARPKHRRQPSFPSTWPAGESDIHSDRTSASTGLHSNASTSKSSIASRQHVNPNPPSRHSSPQASFNLSTGQPLVNPPPKTQAAFVGKLYSMLEDEEIAKTGLIAWSAEGTTFTVPNPTEFSKIVLPRFFKHNNWQSFVRQLNMYSFNKVNDIYSTSTDPQAWEFRHNLFRRGEQHLLPSIKRKSSRPSAAEGAPLASPTDDSGPEVPKAVAGWMRDVGPVGYHPHHHMPSPNAASRAPLYPYTDAPLAPPKLDRPPSRGAPAWDPRHPGASQRMPPPDNQVPVRYHPDPSRPPLSAGRYMPPGYAEPPVYGHPSQMVDTLVSQVMLLEDKVQRLTDVLNNDRIEHVRNNLDFTSYLLQMVGWAAGEQHSPELRALQDTLSRQNADMRQKYEAFMASDALAIMASGGGGRSEEREGRERERERGRFGFETPPPFASHRSAVADPRLPQTSQSSGNILPPGQRPSSLPSGQHITPRTSPLSTMYPETHHLPRPSTSDSIREREAYMTAYPPSLPPHTHHSGMGAGPLSAGPRVPINPPPFGSGTGLGVSVPPPGFRTGASTQDSSERLKPVETSRDSEKDKSHRSAGVGSNKEKDRKKGVDMSYPSPAVESKAKTGLKNLLN
ncbi:hypothetical protein L202_01969 [Cryptococcus amylolentus CBS 6039]|uniref:HSF-type DNA-binding domain-containing protein n=1 Tax=Cryptococcus amylolentus CBS 6039 TaxID=1295533 RepID=A0A1E3I154_9TREE|nr:hypothetical protein L202_01969 [Cryptococcus amylolentus CBS 6039]ODN81551.1 hypothetical protein L202_01969 [Cryptococcus amylolentus CBS 6039]